MSSLPKSEREALDWVEWLVIVSFESLVHLSCDIKASLRISHVFDILFLRNIAWFWAFLRRPDSCVQSWLFIKLGWWFNFRVAECNDIFLHLDERERTLFLVYGAFRFGWFFIFFFTLGVDALKNRQFTKTRVVRIDEFCTVLTVHE